jgi:hypothetical protein
MNKEEKITIMNVNIKGIQTLEELNDLVSLVLPNAEVSIDNFGEVLVYTGLKVKQEQCQIKS